MKQDVLAKRLGISNAYLSEIESGKKAHAITVDLLRRYSDIFDVPVSSLMLFSEHLESGARSEKIRLALASKVVRILDWIDADEEPVAQV